MKNKTTKFILKTLLFFPIGFLFWISASGFEITDWTMPIIAGFVFSFGIVFWQLFEYEKHNDLSIEDFLESKHSLRIDNSNDNWLEINQMIKNPFVKLKILEKTENILRIQIDHRLIDSILTINKTEEDIRIEIRRKFFDFLPDNATNYRTLKRIAEKVRINDGY